MENIKENNKELSDYIGKIVRRTLKVDNSKGNAINPMRGTEQTIKRLIQPHNFRRYFNFEKTTYNPTQPYHEKNYNSEHHFIDFYGCTIIIRKNKAEVINNWHKKQWRLIEATSDKDIQVRIEQIMKEMEDTCINAMQKFILINGGKSDLRPIEIRKAEIGIHGDSYIDKLPKDLILHDTYFKKVYDEKLEFIGEAALKNYISNRALENFNPELVAVLNGLYSCIEKQTVLMEAQSKVIADHGFNIRTHIKVLKGIEKAISKLNNVIQEKQTSLSGWLGR